MIDEGNTICVFTINNHVFTELKMKTYELHVLQLVCFLVLRFYYHVLKLEILISTVKIISSNFKLSLNNLFSVWLETEILDSWEIPRIHETIGLLTLSLNLVASIPINLLSERNYLKLKLK